ncbi:hypothetical protein ACSIGC_08410 [Tenacibaculum sp. ZS6-P6]|uniref:hypothetical protein n=1 Tax=Tenacibaculum sp. ZS6-P6 TaxID=3447503 RepID=UPI003F96B78B
MKEKLSHYWTEFGVWIYFILYILIDIFYGDMISFYYEKIPKPIITSALFLLLIYTTYKAFTPTKENPEILLIPSENDLQRKENTFISLIFIIPAFIMYFFISDSFNVNYIIFFLIVLVNAKNETSLKRTASFQIKKGLITFKNGKEERIFNVSEITSLQVFPNQIIFFKEDSQELISFLQLEKEDFQNIKIYFNKRVPEISINLAQPVTQ